MKKMNKKGFTLVEIMIVVAIIGLLAAIGIPSFTRARSNSIDRAQENNARVLSSAVDEFAMENAKDSTYTVTQADIEGYLKGGWDSLKVGDTVTFPSSKSVEWFSTNASVIVSTMYP